VVDPVPVPRTQHGTQPGDQAGDLDARLVGATERVGHAARLLLRTAASRHGLSIVQAQLLLRIDRQVTAASDLDSSISELTRWFDVRQPTISDAVASLDGKGLVTKTRRGRSRPRELTASGRVVAGDLADWDRPLREALASHPIETRGVVLEVLLDVIGRLHAAEIVTVARNCTTCRFFEPAREPSGRHRCSLLGIPLARTQLRLDCAEHEPGAVSVG